jgi:hypothetical protein
MIMRRLEDADFDAFNSTFRADLDECLQFLKDRNPKEYRSSYERERRRILRVFIISPELEAALLPSRMERPPDSSWATFCFPWMVQESWRSNT